MSALDREVFEGIDQSSTRHESAKGARSEPAHVPPAAALVMSLQRSIGNSRVAQFMEQRDDRASIERATSSGGAPLATDTKMQMEQALGSDLSSVRVHTGGEADASAKQLGAHAYTVGDDVVFANGKYDPGSTSGQRTLAHELTHVVQQRAGPVDGTDAGGGVRVSDPNDRFEQAAEETAKRVVSPQAIAGSRVAAAPEGAAQSEEVHTENGLASIHRPESGEVGRVSA